jgi:hypothetical protein
VPDELIEPIRQAVEAARDPRWQRLLDLIMDFDHAQALAALESLAGES